MHTWYEVVCDEHKIFFHFFCNNPSRTAHLLAAHDIKIEKLLSEHYACALRVCHLDQDLDYLFNNGYTKISFEGSTSNWRVNFDSRPLPPNGALQWPSAREAGLDKPLAFQRPPLPKGAS